MPDISIIIPTYNSEEYISDTLASVINQSVKSWEAIVIDDCSNDNTCRIVSAIADVDDRIRLIQLPKNSGRPAVPRNIGVKESRGNFIAFLDSDDIWRPQKLEMQLLALKNYKSSFCSTRTSQFVNTSDINISQNKKYIFKDIEISRLTHDRLIRKNTICNSSVLLSRKIAIASPFIEDMRYKAIEDYHGWLTMHQKYKLTSIILEAPLTCYRIAATSISRSKYFMIQRNRILYSEYEINGRKLGLKKYYYLATYAYYSLMRRIFNSNHRV